MTWPVLTVGIFAVIIGAVIIINKKKLAAGIAEGQRKTLEKLVK